MSAQQNLNQVEIMHDVIAAFDRQFLTSLAVNTAAHLTRTAPRDTGWLRSNFTPWVNTPPPDVPAPRPEDREQAAQQAQIEGARNAAEGIQINTGLGYQIGFPTGVVNNVPYVLLVKKSREDETNDPAIDPTYYRAPEGWLENGVRKAVDDTEKKFKLVARRAVPNVRTHGSAEFEARFAGL